MSLLFYVIDEHTDDIKYCTKKGMVPHSYDNYILDGHSYMKITQYLYKGHIYDVLEAGQCYSGFMVTLMKLPKLSYKELLNIALYSKKKGERLGAIGVILKDHPVDFENFLLTSREMDIDVLRRDKSIINVIRIINGFIKISSSYVWQLKNILKLCEEIELNLK